MVHVFSGEADHGTPPLAPRLPVGLSYVRGQSAEAGPVPGRGSFDYTRGLAPLRMTETFDPTP